MNIDPSFAGAAGGYALVTTVQDLARFLDALLAGRLFRRRATLKQMLTIGPAQGEGGKVGYGLGIERRALPGGAELIGHLGGAVYRSYVGRLRPTGVTIALAINVEDDPTPLLLPAIEALLAATRRQTADRRRAGCRSAAQAVRDRVRAVVRGKAVAAAGAVVDEVGGLDVAGAVGGDQVVPRRPPPAVA